jgi:hypothetical protein
MKTTRQLLWRLFGFVINIFALLILIGMVFYVLLRYNDPTFQPLELSTISALLGGFALAGGFIDSKFKDLSFTLRRIGALYLISTIAFILFGLYVPLDKQHIEAMSKILVFVIPTGFYIGALCFIGATSWFLWTVPSIFVKSGTEPTKEMEVSDMKRWLRITWQILFALGIVMIAYAFYYVTTGKPSVDYWALGLASLSLALGVYSVDLSKTTDEKMQAIAMNQIDEKLCILYRYAPQSTSRKDVYFDIRSALRLSAWIGAKNRAALKDEFNSVLNAAKAANDTALFNELDDLRKEYKIDTW